MKKLSLPKLPAIPTERLEKLTLVQKVLVYVGTIVLFLGVYIGLLYLPQRGKCDELEMEIERLQSELQLLKRKERELDKLKVELAEKELKFREALQQLPEQKEIPALLTTISNAGKESGLEFLLFKPKTEVPKEFYAEIPIEVLVSGSYHNVAVFFDKTGRLPRIVCVTELSMREAKPMEGEMILKTDCVLTTYRYMETPPEGVQNN
jgi:type IV pilus assembly protein PilO